MKTITVNLGEDSYPIFVGDSILSDKKLLNQYVSGNQILIVTNRSSAACLGCLFSGIFAFVTCRDWLVEIRIVRF